MRERESKRLRRARSRVGRARMSARRQRGFTVTQLIVTVAVVAVVAAFSVMGIASARASMRVQQSAREFAGYLEKARTDAIRRHATSSVQLATSGATSYLVTMDFNLDGVTETREVKLQADSRINHSAVTITFDWRGRLTGPGQSISFEATGGKYPVQLDVTGSGDVTIGEEKFLDSEVPTVTLNNTSVSGTGDTIGSIGTAPPAPAPAAPAPPAPAPGNPAPPSPAPGDPTPPAPAPGNPTPPSPAPGNPTPPAPAPGNPAPPSPAPGNPAPPSPPPSPPAAPACTMTVSPVTTSAAPLTINACNHGGNQCGSTSVTITLLNFATGATVTATSVESNISVNQLSASNGVFTFRVTSLNDTRTDNSFFFTAGAAGACGTKEVFVRTQ
jgi:Tfp pilus assembly protein FimT